MRLAVKLPVPDPFEVKLSLIAGDGVVAQHIPRVVMYPFPSSVMFPPETAVVGWTEVTAAVERVAVIAGFVVNDSSLPYEVPTLFVA